MRLRHREVGRPLDPSYPRSSHRKRLRSRRRRPRQSAAVVRFEHEQLELEVGADVYVETNRTTRLRSVASPASAPTATSAPTSVSNSSCSPAIDRTPNVRGRAERELEPRVATDATSSSGTAETTCRTSASCVWRASASTIEPRLAPRTSSSGLAGAVLTIALRDERRRASPVDQGRPGALTGIIGARRACTVSMISSPRCPAGGRR